VSITLKGLRPKKKICGICHRKFDTLKSNHPRSALRLFSESAHCEPKARTFLKQLPFVCAKPGPEGDAQGNLTDDLQVPQASLWSKYEPCGGVAVGHQQHVGPRRLADLEPLFQCGVRSYRDWRGPGPSSPRLSWICRPAPAAAARHSRDPVPRPQPCLVPALDGEAPGRHVEQDRPHSSPGRRDDIQTARKRECRHCNRSSPWPRPASLAMEGSMDPGRVTPSDIVSDVYA